LVCCDPGARPSCFCRCECKSHGAWPLRDCGAAADPRAARQNVALISIASVMDPALAPRGKHTLHAYLPATEPWSLWEGASLPAGLGLGLGCHWVPASAWNAQALHSSTLEEAVSCM